MSKFKGKNNINSSVRLFAERANYYLDAFEGFPNATHLLDLTFGEFQMYGRVDTKGLPVVPREEFLVSVPMEQQQDTDFRALDFVVEAFTKVQRAFSNSCMLNNIPQDDPYLSVITATKGYEDPVEKYSQYMESIISTFHETYLLQFNNKRFVLSLGDYVNHLVKYLSILSSTFPMTFSSWQKSNKSSIFTSGLAISIADLRIDDDSLKYNTFLTNRIFPYYLNVTKQHGFSVVQNSPWIMVADVDSLALSQRQLQKRGILSVPQMFLSRFDKAHRKDLDLIDDIIIRNYNKFVNIFPIEKEHNICNNNKLRYNIINRSKQDSLEKKLSVMQIARIYGHMKNIEENFVFQKAELDLLIRNTKNFIKSFDKQRGLDYINEKFRQTFKTKYGGINSIIKSNRE